MNGKSSIRIPLVPGAITEFVGSPGAGKTILAFACCRDGQSCHNVLYITLNTIAIPSDNQNFCDRFSALNSNESIGSTGEIKECKNAHTFCYRFHSFLELKAFVANELYRTILGLSIKRIILDGFEDFLYVFKNPRTYFRDIFRMVKTMQRSASESGAAVVIVNSSHGNWKIGGIGILNSYLGLPWEYLIAKRYLVVKKSNCSHASDNKDVIREVMLIMDNMPVTSNNDSGAPNGNCENAEFCLINEAFLQTTRFQKEIIGQFIIKRQTVEWLDEPLA